MYQKERISKMTVKTTNSTEKKVKPQENKIEIEERVVIENKNQNATKQINKDENKKSNKAIVTKKKYLTDLRDLFQAWLGTRFV
jgi:hypothetical protein